MPLKLLMIETTTGIYLGNVLAEEASHIILTDPIKVRFDVYPVPVAQRIGPPLMGFMGNINDLPLPEMITIRQPHVVVIAEADKSYQEIYDNAIKHRDEKRNAKKPLVQ